MFNRAKQWWRGRASQQADSPTDPFDLDRPLMMLSSQDTWRIRDATEGVQVFGAIGSGKTSGSGAMIAKAYLRAGFGGLVMCSKPDERHLWERYAAATGRLDDLLIVTFDETVAGAPAEGWRFNFLNHERIVKHAAVAKLRMWWIWCRRSSVSSRERWTARAETPSGIGR